MKEGDWVVRISQQPLGDKGKFGDHGRILRVFSDDAGKLFGLDVAWITEGGAGSWTQFVGAGRVAPREAWEAERRQKGTA
jgi:hypothetical protein